MNIVEKLKKFHIIYTSLILPFYFFRFLLHTFLTRSFWLLRYYPGHYSSTIPSASQIKRGKELYFKNKNKYCPEIQLRREEQHRLFSEFLEYYDDFQFPENAALSSSYYYSNEMYGFHDGFILYSILRYFKPRSVVEVGSGFSSVLMLETSKLHRLEIDFTFIDINTERLQGRLDGSPVEGTTVIEKDVQEVPLSLFSNLGNNDILFIDSSHVLKIGSDLSHILFNILPVLNPGVIIHFHDVYWPFEYPEKIISEGRNWNEAYVLKAFLQYNTHFEILYFNSFMQNENIQTLEKITPMLAKTSGSSIWLRKIQRTE